MTRPLPAAATLLLFGVTAPARPQEPVAFVNVTVVPMDRERVIPGQTVLVAGGRIVGVGPAAGTRVGRGVRVIDGAGRFLMPGLADMHVHLERDSDELLLHLANGVTTVRDLAGEPLYLTWRDEIAAGRRRGPRLYVATPLIDAPRGKRAWLWRWGGALAIATVLSVALSRMRAGGARARMAAAPVIAGGSLLIGWVLMRAVLPFPDALLPRESLRRWWVGSPGEAARAVREGARRYDQVKLYGGLTRPQFDAAIAAARAAGVHTVAHVPPGLGVLHAADVGLDELAHVYFIVQDLQQEVDTAGRAPDERRAAYIARLLLVVRRLRAAGVSVTTTLMPLPELRERLTDSLAFLARSDLAYRTPAARERVQGQVREGATPAMLADLDEHILWGAEAVARLSLAGTRLVLGTDASPRTAVAGFAAHTELALLVASGLSPYAALQAATVDAAAVARADPRWGLVQPEAAADLLLLERNPLEDIAAVRRPFGVMQGGRWLDRAALDSLLAAVRARRDGP